jgi:hypothetical protein
MINREFAKIDKVIQARWEQFRKPGVLSVRPGYKFTGGWITDKPAIVVTVEKKQDKVPPREKLPDKLDGVAVDVRQASPLDIMRHTAPDTHAELAAGRPEWAPPPMPFERTVLGAAKPGAPLKAPARPKSLAKKIPLAYSPPSGVVLNPVTAVMTIICHASPDAGWPTLGPFIGGTKNSLTVGMYDFTSAHILAKVEASLRTANGPLELVLDHPKLDRTADQSDEATSHQLQQSLGAKLKFAWALTDKDPLVNHWIYPSAYHIKVAVRDSTAFWLSSGNWNNSNQPDADPIKNPVAAGPIIKDSDRDWHVIVEHTGLATTLEAFLRHDYEVAVQWQGASGQAAKISLKSAANAAAKLAVRGKPKKYFSPLVINKEQVTIEPLLTPDNYPDKMLDFINSATSKLYIQMPYIYAPTASDKFQKLVDAVKSKMDAGLDVRIIMSQYEAQGGALEQLKGLGFNMSLIKIQLNLHAKGFIIDSNVVALGSQNWSDEGTQTNRDATLIIRHAGVARYFEQIFMHDWTTMAHQKVGL